MTRRDFVAVTPAASLAARPAESGRSRFVKSICSVMFPGGMPLAECLLRAKSAGFDGLEIRMGDEIKVDSTPDQVKRIGEAAQKANVAVASLWVSQPLSVNPLNSPDPAVRARGVESLKQSIEFASYLNCGAVLIVPGRIGAGAKFQVGYQDTWDRVTAEFRKALPLAGKAKVILTPENVGNKFLLSPLEMRAFVDQFKSPWVQAHFDTGNVMAHGYPQDWILTLGPRIKRMHIKDYKLPNRPEPGRMADLLQGDVDWKEVMAALVKTGYRGFMSPEIGYDREDPGKINKVSRALDQILALA
ncbi:MAG: sugar phosphate isomerase/epimerase family protein [Bryobacteraceae bacterium]